MAAQLETRGREASRLSADLAGSTLDGYPQLRRFREAAPEHVTDEDLLREWERSGHDQNVMNAKVEAWWNDLPDNRAVQGQSTSWEEVSHKKKSQEELSDKFNDMSLRDRKNRGRSAPPTRGGRGGGRGGRASSVGVGRGGRGAPRGPRQPVAGAATNATEQAAATTATVEKVETPVAEAEEEAEVVAPQDQEQQQKQPAQEAQPVHAPTYSAWSANKSFADVVKNQSQAQAQPTAEPVAAEELRPQTNGSAPHEPVDGSNAHTKQGSTRGRGGRGRNARGEGRTYRPKETAVAETVAPAEETHVVHEHAALASVEQPVQIPVAAAQAAAYEPEQEVDEREKGYLNMGKWESAIGGASPEVGSFQFGSFGGASADFDSAAAAAAAWSASEQLGGNNWEVDGDSHALEQGMADQGSNAGVNSLFDTSAQESQNERRTAQPPGFDNADTNAPPGLDGLHPSKHDAPGSRRGHQGGRHYQNQRGPSQHQQQGMPQQPMGYGHPAYGLNMGMGEAPGAYMPYMQGGFGGTGSAPTSTAPTAAGASSSTAAGSSPSSGATMAHMQQPYGAPQPGMMPGSAGYSPYYFYPPMYYQQPTGHYYNRGSQAMYQAPRGPYMSYDQPTSGPMYGQYEGMYGVPHGVPHGGPAPSGKGSSGSKGSSSAPAQHHAAAAPAPDMGLNPGGSYYGSREGQSWYGGQQSWGHGGGAAAAAAAAPYPQSPQTGGSGSGAGFSQSRK